MAQGHAAGLVVVFDFDWSLIGANSDVWVVERLRPELMPRFGQLSGRMGWTQTMDTIIGELSQAGVTRQELERCVAAVPFSDAVRASLSALCDAGCTLCVLSDANQCFIETMLQANGIRHLFADVLTNFSEFEDSGRLRVRPYVDPAAPHRCPLCPDNLCKGAALAEQLGRMDVPERSRIVYIGDGSGDFCPCARLGSEDLVLARVPLGDKRSAEAAPSRFGLIDRIGRTDLVDAAGAAARVVAEVRRWRDGEELAEELQRVASSQSGAG